MLNTQILLEAIFIGVLVLLIGFVLTRIFGPKMTPKFLFCLGFLTHIICEILGLNKWYCENGNACEKGT